MKNEIKVDPLQIALECVMEERDQLLATVERLTAAIEWGIVTLERENARLHFRNELRARAFPPAQQQSCVEPEYEEVEVKTWVRMYNNGDREYFDHEPASQPPSTCEQYVTSFKRRIPKKRMVTKREEVCFTGTVEGVKNKIPYDCRFFAEWQEEE